jgi:carboxypeptidase T
MNIVSHHRNRMKKSITTMCIFIIGLFLVSQSVALPQTTSTNKQTLQQLREQRLTDLQNHAPIVTTGVYHTYDEMTLQLQSLATTYADIMSLASLGKTYEGRDIWIVTLSDDVTQQQDEPEVLFMGAHHGNEKPSYEVLLYFIEYLVEHYQNSSTPEVGKVINSTQIYVIPMVNPDGVQADTRKNCAPNHGWFGLNTEVTSLGVDLNRNYGYRWFFFFLPPWIYRGATSVRDSSEVYRGERPFSENETQCVKQFVETHNISISLTYHTYGELVLYPWGNSLKAPKDASLFHSIGENISTINDYTVASSIDLYPTLGDACDWMYATHHVLAFTIELGTDYAPDNPETVKELCVTHTLVNLYVGQRVQTL